MKWGANNWWILYRIGLLFVSHWDRACAQRDCAYNEPSRTTDQELGYWGNTLKCPSCYEASYSSNLALLITNIANFAPLTLKACAIIGNILFRARLSEGQYLRIAIGEWARTYTHTHIYIYIFLTLRSINMRYDNVSSFWCCYLTLASVWKYICTYSVWPRNAVIATVLHVDRYITEKNK